MIYILGLGIGGIVIVGGAALRLIQQRRAAARRHGRRNKGIAKQKAWDVVFGRRALRRLTFDASHHPED